LQTMGLVDASTFAALKREYEQLSWIMNVIRLCFEGWEVGTFINPKYLGKHHAWLYLVTQRCASSCRRENLPECSYTWTQYIIIRYRICKLLYFWFSNLLERRSRIAFVDPHYD
jgi:hypothetical protein